MSKIGVFICHCGINISGTVDVEKVAADIAHYPGVAMATTYMYMENDSLKPEDCALFLVEVGQAMPKITKVPIVPPRERKEY